METLTEAGNVAREVLGRSPVHGADDFERLRCYRVLRARCPGVAPTTLDQALSTVLPSEASE